MVRLAVHVHVRCACARLLLMHAGLPCMCASTRAPRRCPFDDISLAVRRLRTATGGRVTRVLYVDLDVHQVSTQCTSAARACH